MARAVVLTCGTGSPAPYDLFAALSRRGEQLTIYDDATYADAMGALRANPADYLLLDAAALGAAEAAALPRLPTVSYRTVCALDGELLRYDLNLVLISRVLQPAADRFDDSFRFVGRCVDDPPDEASWRELGPDPLIYIAPPPMAAGRDRFLRACTGAFGGLPFEVVVDEEGSRGASLLDHATLALSAADAGTVEECACGGVPHLMYPGSAEGRMLAARVQELGAGLVLADADLTGGRVRELAGHVMADPAYCRAAEALRQSMNRGGAAAACEEILAFVAGIRTQLH